MISTALTFRWWVEPSWYGNLTVQNKNHLFSIIKVASNMIGMQQLSLADIRVLNGLAWPDKPDWTRRFGAGSGRKNTQMSQGWVGPRASFFIKHISWNTFLAGCKLYIICSVNHRWWRVSLAACFMGRGRRRPDTAAWSYNNKCIRENNAGVRGVGFGPGLGRQLMLVCRAASGSGLKTCGPGRVVIFRPLENSSRYLWQTSVAEGTVDPGQLWPPAFGGICVLPSGWRYRSPRIKNKFSFVNFDLTLIALLSSTLRWLLFRWFDTFTFNLLIGCLL